MDMILVNNWLIGEIVSFRFQLWIVMVHRYNLTTHPHLQVEVLDPIPVPAPWATTLCVSILTTTWQFQNWQQWTFSSITTIDTLLSLSDIGNKLQTFNIGQITVCWHTTPWPYLLQLYIVLLIQLNELGWTIFNMDHILLNLTLDASSTNNILLPNTPIAHIQVDFIGLVVPAMADPNSLHNSAMAVNLVFNLLYSHHPTTD